MSAPIYNLVKPDQGASKSVEARVLSVQFGDGYSQEVADGINNLVETWTVSFTNRTQAEIQAIDDFFTALRGYLPFQWTTPDGKIKLFKCKKWTPSYSHSLDSSLTATFTQHFGP